MIQTERLIIKVMTIEDMENRISKEKDEEMKIAYTEMLTGAILHPNQYEFWADWDIRLRSDITASVGDLCFKGLNSDGMVEIGYGIEPEHQNEGYATEAVRAMVAWVLGQPGVTRVEAETEPNNIASQRVLEKVGFVKNGVMGLEGPRFSYVSSKAKEVIS